MSAVCFSVAEVVGAELECQSRRALDGRPLSYRVVPPCYCDDVLIDTSHVMDRAGVPDPRSLVLGLDSNIPQLYGSMTASSDDDGWAEPIQGYRMKM